MGKQDIRSFFANTAAKVNTTRTTASIAPSSSSSSSSGSARKGGDSDRNPKKRPAEDADDDDDVREIPVSSKYFSGGAKHSAKKVHEDVADPADKKVLQAIALKKEAPVRKTGVAASLFDDDDDEPVKKTKVDSDDDDDDFSMGSKPSKVSAAKSPAKSPVKPPVKSPSKTTSTTSTTRKIPGVASSSTKPAPMEIASDDDDSNDGREKAASSSSSWNPYKKSAYASKSTPPAQAATPKKSPSKPAVAAAAAAKSKPKPKPKESSDDDGSNGSDGGDGAEDAAEKADAKKKFDYRARFLKYANREPPKALGSKPIPVGQPNCLEGLTFVLTGILESITREDTADLIKRYGGKVTQSISKKTSYVVMGREPGDSKVAKAKELHTKILDEDELFNLVSTRSPSGASTSASSASSASSRPSASSKASESRKQAEALSSSSSAAGPPTTSFSSSSSPAKGQASKSAPIASSAVKRLPAISSAPPTSSSTLPAASSALLSEKYRPKTSRDIVGNKENVERLKKWLLSWEKSQSPAAQAAPASKSAAGKDQASPAKFKGALLSGPPGIGKTTTALIVARECGFEPIEFNASDTRSKNALQQQVSESMGSHSVSEYFGGAARQKAFSSSSSADSTIDASANVKHVLIMDEVDGMAGGDRGGLAEINKLIKQSKIPVICICNDHSNPKMKTLTQNCYDLKFQRPTALQVLSRLKSIVAIEKLAVEDNALSQLIEASNRDIRQCLNLLSVWRRESRATEAAKKITYDDVKKKMSTAAKDTRLGPFDATQQLLRYSSETPKLTIDECLDLFFMDYDFVPLLNQENYLKVEPIINQRDLGPRETMDLKKLDKLSETADAFSDSDLVSVQVRQRQQWSLLPVQGVFSAVIPSKVMRGAMGWRVDMSAWMGKNSTTRKNLGLLSDLQLHMRINSTADRTQVCLTYLPVLRRALTQPLIARQKEGIPQVIEVMDTYYLTREDWDNVLSLTQFENTPPLAIESTVKSAFTRAYTSSAHASPFAPPPAASKTRGKPGFGEDGLVDGEEEASGSASKQSQADDDDEAKGGGGGDGDDDDDDIDKDTLVKRKPASKSKGKTTVAAASKGKGKAKAK